MRIQSNVTVTIALKGKAPVKVVRGENTLAPDVGAALTASDYYQALVRAGHIQELKDKPAKEAKAEPKKD